MSIVRTPRCYFFGVGEGKGLVRVVVAVIVGVTYGPMVTCTVEGRMLTTLIPLGTLTVGVI
jgi:hypothetical protein